MPGNYKASELIIKQEHLKELNAGAESYLYSIIQQFWITHGRNAVRRTLRKYIISFRVKPKSYGYQMGALQTVRVKPAFAFLNVGVGYAGPSDMKFSNLRNSRIIKSYICIFICVTTNAIHLELLTDLSTVGFLNCFKRFTSSKGKSTTIHSTT